MQPTVQRDDKQADLDDLVAILDHDPSRVMLEPPDLHADLVDRTPQLAAELPPPDPALRATPSNDNGAPQPRARGSFLRGVVRTFVAMTVGAAVTVGWLSYGEAARQMIAGWSPQLHVAASAPAQAEDGKVPDQPAAASNASVEQQPPARPVTVAGAVAPPAPAPEATAPSQAEPVQVAATPELAPKVEEMAREIASLRETIAQLKAGQQQLSRDLAKAIEQEPRRKTATAPPPPPAPRPAAAAPRNPPPAYTPPQPAYASPQQRQVYVAPPYVPPPQVYTPPPPQVYVPPPEPGYAPVPRPPRPLP